MEVYISIHEIEFGNLQPNHISVVFKKYGTDDKYMIDTHSMTQSQDKKTYCFGPKMFVFKDYNSTQSPTDISFINYKWGVGIDIDGGDTTIISNMRMTIKQKSLV